MFLQMDVKIFIVGKKKPLHYYFNLIQNGQLFPYCAILPFH